MQLYAIIIATLGIAIISGDQMANEKHVMLRCSHIHGMRSWVDKLRSICESESGGPYRWDVGTDQIPATVQQPRPPRTSQQKPQCKPEDWEWDWETASITGGSLTGLGLLGLVLKAAGVIWRQGPRQGIQQVVMDPEIQQQGAALVRGLVARRAGAQMPAAAEGGGVIINMPMTEGRARDNQRSVTSGF